MISNNAGFSLVELLVAMVITLIGMLGLLQGINLALDTTLANSMRNEGVAVAEQIMSQSKQQIFANITATGVKVLPAESRRFRNAIKDYSVVKEVVVLGDKSKRIQVGTTWMHRGSRFEHHISTVVTNTN